MKVIRRLWLGILILVILSPLGLILPELFKAQEAWGEWGKDRLKELVGFVPLGMERLADIWSAPFADYTFKGWQQGIWRSSFSYIFSGLVGVLSTSLFAFLIGKFLVQKNKQKKE